MCLDNYTQNIRIIVASNERLAMNKRFLRIFGLLGLLIASMSVMGQDPHFSQFYANPIYLNPAMAGARKCPSAHIIYRNQYPELAAFRTVSASYDQFIDALGGGIGIIITDDNAGDGTLGIFEVNAMYSYHLVLSRKLSLLVGFQAGWRQRTLDWSSLRFGDQIDNLYGFVRPTQEIPGVDQVSHVDFGTGFVLFSDMFYVGGAFHHLTEPDDPFLVESKLPMKMTFHGGAQIPIGRRVSNNASDQTTINPGILFQTQGPNEQLNYLLSISKGAITGGLSFRHNFNNADAMVVLIGFSPDRWTLGYSYDYTVSKFSNQAGGAHEISLGYQFKCATKKTKYKTLNCPKF
jgi:type IX secretion system PorP/SprF family membrane protein